MPLSLEQLDDIGPLYAPQGDGVLPTIMILHGSEGPGSGWSHRFAAILAAHGFGAIPYGYGMGDVWGAGDIRDVDVAGVPAAGHRILRHPRISRLGLLGWSRGGELAMHIAAIDPDPFACIAAHAPADHVVGPFEAVAFRAGVQRPQPDPANRAWRWAGHDDALQPGAPIAIENHCGPVFLSVGTDDQVWDHTMTLGLARRLTDAGNPPDIWVAEGQGHAFDFATEPELWRRLSTFFNKHLGETA